MVKEKAERVYRFEQSNLLGISAAKRARGYKTRDPDMSYVIAAAEAVANNIKKSMALPHPYGRLQFGADLDLHFRTLIGTGRILTWLPWW